MPPELLNRISVCVQPLVFENSAPGFPYSTQGTVFLIGYAGRTFVLTARHSLNPENCPAICVFPFDTSQQIIPLKDVFFVSREYFDDDFADVAVIEIDMNNITNPEVSKARIIDLDRALGDWLSKSESAEFFVIGYPDDFSSIDYDLETMTHNRIAMKGYYAGESELDYLHKLNIQKPYNLDSFSGFSGGPVFAWIENPEKSRGQVILCGMVLRGTASSGIIHFLDTSFLVAALNAKLKLD